MRIRPELADRASVPPLVVPRGRSAAPRRLETPARLWLVGVEGVGMSAAAEILAARGFDVRGTDRRPGARSARLRGLGIEVVEGETAVMPG